LAKLVISADFGDAADAVRAARIVRKVGPGGRTREQPTVTERRLREIQYARNIMTDGLQVYKNRSMAMSSSDLPNECERSARHIARPLTVLVALMCTGCISLVDPRLGPEGKAGWVVKRYTVDELREHRPSCLATLPAEEIETKRYVEVSVAKGRGRRYVAAMLPDTLSANIGDQVEVAPNRCEQGHVPVVRQILKLHR
jgi:hypothetical protein